MKSNTNAEVVRLAKKSKSPVVQIHGDDTASTSVEDGHSPARRVFPPLKAGANPVSGSVAINNPVLHFGGDVAQDLIKKEVNEHFAKAFRHMDAWKKEKRERKGMLKAMRDR